MIRSASFWKDEAEAPLLNRNAGFVRPEAVDDLVRRAEQWIDLCKVKGDIEFPVWKTSCADEASQRIFKLDAERTFKNTKHRQTLIETLATIYQETQDYHQGMGFIVAFLLLFLEKEAVARLVLGLHRHYVPGYFKAAPMAYVRDAKAFERILEKLHPTLHKHVTTLVPAEAYCSKWFVGFNIHVLPFPAVADFLEAFLSQGPDFHFQYAVSLVSQTQQDILATRDVAKVLAYLRLDSAEYPDDKTAADDATPGSFFAKIVENARTVDLSDVDIEALRTDILTEMAERDAKRKQREAELELEEEEDEIVFSDEEEAEEE